ncbi:MAG: hypothetical protein H0T97_01975 [Actinobacteria bacterium]|nr:hypothetical protein [Actinomycetota bacterium]
MRAETVTIDRDVVESFVVEVDALGLFDSLLNAGNETKFCEHVYSILDPFERAAFGSLSDEAAEELHNRAHERARSLAHSWFGEVLDGAR